MKTWPWFLLLFATLLAAPIAHADARSNCRTDRDDITTCSEDRGNTSVLIVDLNNPRIRVQTVMANDVLDVRPRDEQRERVVQIAQRYRDQNVIIAINGDYFGAGRGPEGPTVVQGRRLDTPESITTNPSRYRRATLMLSRSGSAAIAHLNPIDLPAPFVYRDLIFNAISGGPVILLNGQVLPEALSCFVDRIPINTCRRTQQSVAGLNADGTALYLAVSTQRSTGEMAQLLKDYGADSALKLDAGGSSQLWYRGRTLLNSDRGVANALLVFVEDRPRHAAELLVRPPVLVLESGERAVIQVLLRNSGYLGWTFDRFYGLRRFSGAAPAADFVRLSEDVPPGEHGAVSLSIDVRGRPRVYESTWQMATPFESFGPQIPLRVIVIPPGADDLRGQIQVLLDRAAKLSDKRFAQGWPALAAQIRQMVRTWVAETLGPCKGCSEKSME